MAETRLAPFTTGGFSGGALSGASGSGARLQRTAAEQLARSATGGFAGGIAGAPTPMDIMNALPLTKKLKEKGVTRVLDVLVAMKERGVFKKLEEKEPEEVAQTNEAAEAIHQEFTLLKGVVTELSICLLYTSFPCTNKIRSGAMILISFFSLLI